MSIRVRGLGVRATRWLALACALAAVATLWARTGSTTQTSAWLLRTGLPVGMVVAESDVSKVQVHVPDAARVGLIQANPVGQRIAVTVAEGALLRRTDVTAQPAPGIRVVSVTIDGGHAPESLTRGARVDVWVTPNAVLASDVTIKSVQVATSVIVKSASKPGPTGTVAVELQVPRSRVAAVVAASHAGAVDLVTVPDLTSAGVR